MLTGSELDELSPFNPSGDLGGTVSVLVSVSLDLDLVLYLYLLLILYAHVIGGLSNVSDTLVISSLILLEPLIIFYNVISILPRYSTFAL